MTTSLSEVFPIQDITNDGIIVNGEGSLTFALKLTLPSLYSLDGENYNKLTTLLINSFSDLPSGVTIHKQDFYFQEKHKNQEVKGFTDRMDSQLFVGKDFLQHYSNLYITIPKESKTKIKTQSNDNSLLRLSDFLFKRPFANYDDYIVKAKDIFASFLNTLNEIKVFKSHVMNKEEVIAAVYDYTSLNFGVPTKYTDISITPNIEVSEEFLQIENDKIGIISFIGEGEKVSTFRTHGETNLEVGYVYPITLGFNEPHIVNTVIELCDNEKLLQHLETESRLLNPLMAFGSTGASYKKKDIEAYKHAVIDSNARTCLFNQNIIVKAPHVEDLKKLCDIAVSKYKQINSANALIENKQIANLFFANIPSNANKNFRNTIATVNQSVNYLSFETHFKNDSNGFNFADRYNRPVVVDLLDQDLKYGATAKNKVVFGTTGSGKSVWINHYISQCHYNNYHTIILDVGGSYQRITKLLGGNYYDSSNKEFLRFNIFSCSRDAQGNYLYKEDEGYQVTFIVTILNLICKGGTSFTLEEKSLLKNAIEHFYNDINSKKEVATLTKFYNFLDKFEKEILDPEYKEFINFPSIKLTLQNYVEGGQYDKLLNLEEDLSIAENRLIVFDVEAIQKNEDLRDIVSIIIINLVINKLDKIPLTERKAFIIDEAIDFLMGDMGEFIAEMYRKIRKKSGEVALATQDPTFLKACPELVRNSILSNSAFKVILGINQETKEESYKILGLNTRDTSLIESIKHGKGYREFFLKIGHTPFIFRNMLSKGSISVYTTSDEDGKTRIDQLVNELGSVELAVENYLIELEEQ